MDSGGWFKQSQPPEQIIKAGTTKVKNINWLKTGGINIRIMRLLVIVAAVLMLVSFSMPWWMTDAVAGGGGAFYIRIYGHGLQHNMYQLQEYIAADETPIYQTVTAWVFAALVAIISLLSAWLKGLKSSLLLAGMGLAYLAYTLVAMFVVISGRLEEYNIALQGISSSGMFRQVNIVFDSAIGTGFYLALVSGGLLLIIALFRCLADGRKNRESISPS